MFLRKPWVGSMRVKPCVEYKVRACHLKQPQSWTLLILFFNRCTSSPQVYTRTSFTVKTLLNLRSQAALSCPVGRLRLLFINVLLVLNPSTNMFL